MKEEQLEWRCFRLSKDEVCWRRFEWCVGNGEIYILDARLSGQGSIDVSCLRERTRKKIPYEKLVEYLLKITRVLMKSGTNLYSIKFYNIL